MLAHLKSLEWIGAGMDPWTPNSNLFLNFGHDHVLQIQDILKEEGGRQARKTDPQPLSNPTSAMSRVRVSKHTSPRPNCVCISQHHFSSGSSVGPFGWWGLQSPYRWGVKPSWAGISEFICRVFRSGRSVSSLGQIWDRIHENIFTFQRSILTIAMKRWAPSPHRQKGREGARIRVRGCRGDNNHNHKDFEMSNNLELRIEQQTQKIEYTNYWEKKCSHICS